MYFHLVRRSTIILAAGALAFGLAACGSSAEKTSDMKGGTMSPSSSASAMMKDDKMMSPSASAMMKDDKMMSPSASAMMENKDAMMSPSAMGENK